MTGSVFDGEDVVQDTLVKAYRALKTTHEPPPLRPWLFRIAHNTAIDFLRRYERKNVELVGNVPDVVDADERVVDPEMVEASLTIFVDLPPVQRSALVLKDVLGHSLAETAEAMDTTVSAVKAALFRARTNVALARSDATGAERGHGGTRRSRTSDADDASFRRYVELFNQRDWDGLRSMLSEEARLDLVSRTQEHGSAVRRYYSRYAEITDTEELRAEYGSVDGVAAIAVFRPASSLVPSYFIQLEWLGQRLAVIRDFRYVPYITDGARFTPG
jgi:RNA polymerase sigma-70 factor (ECF subfamily)